MSAARIIVSGATTAITRRTNLRKAFLSPWHPLVDRIWLYELALAQRQTEVEVHHTTRVITHHHTSVTPPRNNLPSFTRLFHGEVSCALNTLLARERYDAPGQIFDGRSSHYLRLLDAAAQASHLIYEHLNPVAAGLVDRPEHMPGFTFDFGLWKTGFIDVERPPVYFSSRHPSSLRLRLTPPPLLYEAFGGNLDALVHHMKRLTEHGLRALRSARTRPVLGARRVQRLHPWNEPRTLREPGGRPAPTFRVGARGIVGQQLEIAGAVETHDFRVQHEKARCARRDGDHDAVFPYGTYEAVVLRGAEVASAPNAGALVTMPGPTTADITRRLEQAPAAATPHALIDAVREAFVEEAAEIVETTQMSLPANVPVPSSKPNAKTPTSAESESDTDGTRPEVLTRHVGDRRPQPERDQAARLVILRDRRRGRPRADATPHGCDPPDEPQKA